jgi:Spy/CpxP family protein refolding chaperone
MLLWAVVTIVLAAATAFVVSRNTGTQASGGSEKDFHHWMHEQLQLTEAQHEALEPLEQAFEVRNAKLRSEMDEAGHELAGAVRKGDSDSPEIRAALVRLNAAQAELQHVMLEHFFAMKEHLDPDQAEKVLEWTHDSIVHE